MPGKPFQDDLNSGVVFKPEVIPLSVEKPQPARRPGAWAGLLWCEWFAHSRMLLIFLAIWLAVAWTLPLFGSPVWILVVGLAYALLGGPAYGGGDVLEGSEEFSFALPATRSERYLARLAVGGGALLILTLMDLAMLGLDLPQALAGFYVNTSLLKPIEVTDTDPAYGLVLAFPFAVFSAAFTVAAVARSRAMVLMAWFWGGLGALLVFFLGIQYENLIWNKLTGIFTGPLLLAAGVTVLWIGHRLYCRKEVGLVTRPIQLPVRWWVWLILFLLGMVLASLLVGSLARQFPHVIGIFR